MSLQVTINQKTLDEVFAHSIAEYPAEACGWILRDSTGKLTYVAAENLQDKYHKLDP